MHRFERWSVTRVIVLAAVFVLLAAACSDDGSADGERGVTTARPGAEIEGNPVTSFAPDGNERVAVVGLSQGETLPMHAMPGTTVIAQIPADADDLFGFGESFQTADGQVWWLVRWADEQGWIVPGAAYVSPPDDVSARVAGSLANTRYSALDTLIGEVAGLYGDDFAVVSQSDPSAAGDVTTVIDVLRNDLVIAGQRVEIVTNDDGQGARLTAASQSWLCKRGIADGACAG